MSQSIITLAFEQYKAECESQNKIVELDEFVLANIPNQDQNLLIDRDEELPPPEQVVYVSPVSQQGYVNGNAVVYSLNMDTRIGDFEFNWIGLRNKASGVLAAISHIPAIHKTKTINGSQNGNAITRSVLMSYVGAKTLANINVDASTWQIDFTARLTGMDERERLANIDHYGQAAFLSDGFKVVKSSSTYKANVGIGYVGGLRCDAPSQITVNNVQPNGAVYLKASWQGQLTSQWQTVYELVYSKTLLSNVIDSNGHEHYVTKVADIDGSGNAIDRRLVGGSDEYERKNHSQETYLPKANGTLETELKMPDYNVINRRFIMLENVRTQYILLCQNAKKNDINGVIRIDRTTGSYQTAVLNVVVTSSVYEMRGGALTSLQVLENNEVYRLVTLIHNSISYVAIEYVGSLFPSNICTFTGRYLSTAGANIKVVPDSDVVNVAEFGGNTKYNINADKLTVNENDVYHVGNKPTKEDVSLGSVSNFAISHSYSKEGKDKYASEYALNALYKAVKESTKYALLTASNTPSLNRVLPANTRILIPNPFGDTTPVQLIIELFIGGEWSDPGWAWASTSPYSEGTTVNYVEGSGIAIQTGRRSVSGVSNATGGGHTSGAVLTSIDAGKWRVHVSKMQSL